MVVMVLCSKFKHCATFVFELQVYTGEMHRWNAVYSVSYEREPDNNFKVG